MSSEGGAGRQRLVSRGRAQKASSRDGPGGQAWSHAIMPTTWFVNPEPFLLFPMAARCQSLRLLALALEFGPMIFRGERVLNHVRTCLENAKQKKKNKKTKKETKEKQKKNKRKTEVWKNKTNQNRKVPRLLSNINCETPVAFSQSNHSAPLHGCSHMPEQTTHYLHSITKPARHAFL